MELRQSLLVVAATIAFVAPGAAYPANEGERIVNEVCSGCHTAKTRPLDKIQKTRGEWGEAVERMIGYGADVPKASLPQLLDYLAATHGPAGNAKK